MTAVSWGKVVSAGVPRVSGRTSRHGRGPVAALGTGVRLILVVALIIMLAAAVGLGMFIFSRLGPTGALATPSYIG